MKMLVEIIVEDQGSQYVQQVRSPEFARELLQLLQKYGFDAKLLETRGDKVL